MNWLAKYDHYQEDIAQMKYIAEWVNRKEERKAKRRKFFRVLMFRLIGSIVKS